MQAFSAGGTLSSRKLSVAVLHPLHTILLLCSSMLPGQDPGPMPAEAVLSVPTLELVHSFLKAEEAGPCR